MKQAIKRILKTAGYEIRRRGYEIQDSSPDQRILKGHITEIQHIDYFSRLSEIVKDVPGAFVECGVAYGDSLLVLTALAGKWQPPRNVWGFDSFQGFPPSSPEDKAPGFDGSWIGKPRYDKTSVAVVQSFLTRHGVSPDSVKLVEGFFEDTLDQYSGEQISLLHIDADLYASYKVVLQEFWPLVAEGGVVAFDDFPRSDYARDESFRWPGALQATKEFFGDLSDIVEDPLCHRHYLVKR